ncbi:MAG: EamA family transporter [Rubripirellula sp.]
MSRTTANSLLLFAGAIWGMRFVAQQSVMDRMSTMLFIALRFLVAVLTVAPFAIKELIHRRPDCTLSEIKSSEVSAGKRLKWTT